MVSFSAVNDSITTGYVGSLTGLRAGEGVTMPYRESAMAVEPTIPSNAPGAGALLRLIRDGQASTRAELVALTGLARSTVAQRMDALLAQRLVVPAGGSVSTGGRPPQMFAFNRDAGVVLAADLGATHSRLAVTDLGGEVLVEGAEDIAIAQGPEAVLAWLEKTFDELLARVGRTHSDVRGVGVGVPGPVEFATGTPVAPPIMPGWDGYRVSDRLLDYFGAPTLVDNDVNIMALGEHWKAWRAYDHLLFVKVATGIGCGIITDGRIHRGAQGAAGDIGHIHVPGNEEICRCGNRGCLEAVAGGGAMAARLRSQGIEAENSRDVVRHVRDGRPEAMQLVRQAGRELGEVLAASVNFFNPGVIVIGGDIAHADEHLLAGVREVVYQRAVPLGTRSLRIVRSALDDRAGVIGAAVMVIEHVLAPDVVDRMLANAAS
jgi:predicted NBD/HSP70 family sugar kinase